MIHVKYLQRRWLFATLDFLGVLGTFYITLIVRASVPLPLFEGLIPLDPNATFVRMLLPTISLAAIFSLTQYVLGIYDLWATSSIAAWSQRLSLPNFFLIASAFTILYLKQQFDFPRSILVTTGCLNMLVGVLWRRLYFWEVEKKRSEVVLVGGIERCLQVAKEFDLLPFAGRVFVSAIFTPNKVEQCHASNHKMYHLSDFQKYANEHPYTSIIVVPSDLGYDNTFGEVLSAAKRGVPVYAMPSAYEILLGRLRHIQVNDLPLLELKLEPPSAIFSLFKRGLDILLAFALLVLLSPILAAVAIIVKLSSPGPVLYSQDRVGLNGMVFKVYKFRSMVQDAEKTTGPVLAIKRDPRVTKFGQFMRTTRIDELPQLLNIIKGEMSFVGPRPERPMFVNRFEKEIPGYKERTRIRPGVTGLAQVSGTYESSAEIKLKYDLAYLANQSILLDLQILARTAKTVILRAGQ